MTSKTHSMCVWLAFLHSRATFCWIHMAWRACHPPCVSLGLKFCVKFSFSKYNTHFSENWVVFPFADRLALVVFLLNSYIKCGRWDGHILCDSCPRHMNDTCPWDRHLHCLVWFKISQLSELPHVADGVKNVCGEHPEEDPWRQDGVFHSGSRNSGMQLLTQWYMQMLTQSQWAKETCRESFHVPEEKQGNQERVWEKNVW